MKIIHTSDWHLGHQLYGYDRTEEQLSMLAQIRDITGRERPDALVIAGDIFHTPTPGAQVQRMYTDALLDIRNASPETVVVVTAGNHDSQSKIEVDRNLWQLAGVHVVGSIGRRDDGGADYSKHIIPIGDKGFVAAVPYVFEQNYPPAPGDESRQRAFFHGLLEAVAARNAGRLPVVLTAHLAVAGCDMSGNKVNDDGVGTIEFTPLSDFGDGWDYLALGHIHRPQTLGGGDGRRVARYSGTPLAVRFEEAYRHSVSIVRLESGRKPEVETVEIHNPRPLLTIPDHPATLDEALEALARVEGKAYVRLSIKAGTVLPPDANERAVAATDGRECRFCLYKVETAGRREAAGPAAGLTAEELREMTVEEVARRYMERRGISDDTFLEMMNDINRQLEEEDRQ